MQLHELVDLENVLEFKDPGLVIVGEHYLDPVGFARLHDRCVADLKDLWVAQDANFGHQARVVL